MAFQKTWRCKHIGQISRPEASCRQPAASADPHIALAQCSRISMPRDAASQLAPHHRLAQFVADDRALRIGI